MTLINAHLAVYYCILGLVTHGMNTSAYYAFPMTRVRIAKVMPILRDELMSGHAYTVWSLP